MEGNQRCGPRGARGGCCSRGCCGLHPELHRLAHGADRREAVASSCQWHFLLSAALITLIMPPFTHPSHWLLQLDGVDTIYICFAFDRDRKTVTHPEIHQIYEGVPTLKAALIENPDGGIAYGAPQQQHQVQYSAPPPYGAPPHQHQVQMYSAPPPYPGYAQQNPYSATSNGGN